MPWSGQADMAVSSSVGSNIFDILAPGMMENKMEATIV